jgi:hypothetical protein
MAELTAIEKAVIKTIGTSTEKWAPISWIETTNAQEQAIRICVLSGILDAKLPLTVSVPPATRHFKMIFTVSGVFDAEMGLHVQAAVGRRGWKGPQINMEPGHFSHLRLTADGEQAKRDLLVNPVSVVSILCGFNGMPGLRAAGSARVDYEWEVTGTFDQPPPNATNDLGELDEAAFRQSILSRPGIPNLSDSDLQRLGKLVAKEGPNTQSLSDMANEVGPDPEKARLREILKSNFVRRGRDQFPGAPAMISAEWGIASASRDCASRIYEYIGRGKKVYVNDRDLGCDPAPNTTKHLQIKFADVSSLTLNTDDCINEALARHYARSKSPQVENEPPQQKGVPIQNIPETNSQPILTGLQADAFSIIKRHTVESRISGKAIIEALQAEFRRTTSENTLTTHIIPALKPLGVKSAPKRGYWYEPPKQK